MHLRNVLLGAALGLGLLTPSSQAGIGFDWGNGPLADPSNVLFSNPNSSPLTNTVVAQLNDSTLQVKFASTQYLFGHGGQARLEARSTSGADGSQVGLQNVTIEVLGGTYAGLIINPFVQANGQNAVGVAGGILTVSVTNVAGATREFALSQAQNFLTVTATGTDRIVKTVLSYRDSEGNPLGFTDLRQVRIGGVAAVPEPGFVTLVATGLGATGVCGLRRLRRKQTA